VGQSWLFFSQYRSNRMVNSSVKRRSAINMGTFNPAVPAPRKARQAKGERLRAHATAEQEEQHTVGATNHLQLRSLNHAGHICEEPCPATLLLPPTVPPTNQAAHHVHHVDHGQGCQLLHQRHGEYGAGHHIADWCDEGHLQERHCQRVMESEVGEHGLQRVR
jgi:hypothetical protein